MIHRDIKPENILLMDEDLTVKIGDFGLAKIVGEASFTTTLCGTPSYVAPEILAHNGKARRYTKAVDIWSVGVVLYICLCGFPPFSDELQNERFPYNLADQIRQGLFDYPSPYWDPVGDLARTFLPRPQTLLVHLTNPPTVDLIDSMLTVNPEKRFTVDQCLAHPWMTEKPTAVNDSTNGLVSGLAGLEMSRRAPFRERTLLSSINTVHVMDRVPAGAGRPDVKVYSKNPVGGKVVGAPPTPKREMRPDDNRGPDEFMEMGGKGDQELFGNDGGSKYPTKDIGGEGPAGAEAKEKGKPKAKGKKGGR